jgi:prophage DNA circulation protein
MPTSILKNAEAFDFTTLDGERLEMFGELLSWSDETRTGVVEKQVVRRAGALHQKMGSPPRKFSAKCVIMGGDVTARYRRLCDVVQAQPEGRVTHPRWGNFRAVVESVSASETPSENTNLIEVSISFAETGLHDPPKPAPSAKAQTAAAHAQASASTSAASGGGVAVAGAALQNAAGGFLVAISAAESGLGTIGDVTASYAAMSAQAVALDALQAPKEARRAAALSLSSALQAQARYLAGRPPLVTYTVPSSTSLSALCQSLYGSRANDARAEILRNNRILRPFRITAGTVLLISDPSLTVTTVE